MNERIKKLRRTLDLTQQEFADKIGVKRNTIATYEGGRNEPSDAALMLICRTFAVNEVWLRTGEGEMFTQDATSELDALVRKYGLSDAERILIDKFVKLKPEIREAFTEFIQDVADAVGKEDVEQEPELDIDAEVEDYRRQLVEQKKAGAGLSASDGGSSITKEVS